VPDRRTTRDLELVVTLPEAVGDQIANEFGLRTTLGVLVELLAGAKGHVIVGAPFIQGDAALHAEPLASAFRSALERGVRVDIISTGASLANLRLGQLRRVAGRGLRTFQPRGNTEDARSLGSHAKFFLADGQAAYVGSANFTHMGIGGHLEIGVLLSGAPARQLWHVVTRLFDIGYLIEVSGS
jgi:phosphatidylserine/phosphatidylglycerophosphate/cardiolipin synthase-like enzyme